jgi:hypothetical protein
VEVAGICYPEALAMVAVPCGLAQMPVLHVVNGQCHLPFAARWHLGGCFIGSDVPWLWREPQARLWLRSVPAVCHLQLAHELLLIETAHVHRLRALSGDRLCISQDLQNKSEGL